MDEAKLRDARAALRVESFGISILELRGDKIARESIYIAEAWVAPEWRARWRVAPS